MVQLVLPVNKVFQVQRQHKVVLALQAVQVLPALLD
jgi:hypothetical protein